MTQNLYISSLVLGFIGCIGIIVSFIAQLRSMYINRDPHGTSWGLIILQILASLFLGISSSINIYVDGISSLPFLVTNITVMLLFFVMSYFKCKFSNELETEQSA